jgi:hypothetical protein
MQQRAQGDELAAGNGRCRNAGEKVRSVENATLGNNRKIDVSRIPHAAFSRRGRMGNGQPEEKQGKPVTDRVLIRPGDGVTLTSGLLVKLLRKELGVRGRVLNAAEGTRLQRVLQELVRKHNRISTGREGGGGPRREHSHNKTTREHKKKR